MLIHHDREQCIMVMEDLGNTDLWALRNEPWEIRQEFYKRLWLSFSNSHSFPAEDFPSEEVKLMGSLLDPSSINGNNIISGTTL